MSSTSVSFSFKLKSSYWDTGYDVNNPFEANTPDAAEFDEKGYWLTAGTSDGQQGIPSKMPLIPMAYQLDYKTGYDSGIWFRKVFNQG